MDLAALLGDGADEDAALIEALRQQQAQQQQDKAGLQEALARQQSQAGGLRALSLLTSMGDNPLLRGIQRAAGEQGGQMEGLAARTEGRLAQAKGGLGLMDAIRIKQGRDKLKQAKFEYDEEKKRREAEAAASAQKDAKKDAEGILERETSVRREYQMLPEVKSFADTESNWNTLQKALKDPTGMGATTAVFSVMKLLDPGVAVMQGDVDLIRSSGGKAAQWANVYESVLNGNPLSEKVRQDIYRQGETLYRNRAAAKNKRAAQYRALAQEMGVNPAHVILDVPTAPDIDLSDSPTENAYQIGTAQPARRAGSANSRKAQPAATGLPPPPAGKVRVKIGGKVGLIPREKLEAAKKRGAVEVP